MSHQENREIPDPQVPEKARRRRFSAAQKLKFLEQADCCKPGELGSLLRREGLYSSQLSSWRKQREEGTLAALSKKRGRKPKDDPSARRLASLERENQQLRRKLEKAEIIIDVQKKLSRALEKLAEQEGS